MRPDAGRVFRYWLRTFELFLEALRDERQAEVGRTSSDSSSSEPKKLRLLLTFLSPTIFEYVEDAQSYDETIKILEKTYRKQKIPYLPDTCWLPEDNVPTSLWRNSYKL